MRVERPERAERVEGLRFLNRVPLRQMTVAPFFDRFASRQLTSRAMHLLAPIPIIFGVVGVIFGFLWLVAAGSDEDGGPETGLFFLFGMWYIAMRVMKA